MDLRKLRFKMLAEAIVDKIIAPLAPYATPGATGATGLSSRAGWGPHSVRGCERQGIVANE
jgi:hypothetical protein